MYEMKVYLMLNEDSIVEYWGTSYSEGMIETDLCFTDPLLDKIGSVKYIDGELVLDNIDNILNYAKKMKDEELNDACKEAIMGGFYHVVDGVKYLFSFDTEAQLNFQGAERLLSQGIVEEIMWTVKDEDYNYTRIPINKEVMDELSIAILNHKNNNISKYRDFLTPILQGATTIEKIESIKW